MVLALYVYAKSWNFWKLYQKYVLLLKSKSLIEFFFLSFFRSFLRENWILDITCCFLICVGTSPVVNLQLLFLKLKMHLGMKVSWNLGSRCRCLYRNKKVNTYCGSYIHVIT